MGIEVRLSTQFRVLGPLEVAHDGVPVRLGGERQRALLALMVIHANALVTTERLIEHLFGGEPSQSAANAVHVAVSRLRRALHCGDELPAADAPRRVRALGRARSTRRGTVRAPARPGPAGRRRR